MQQQLSYYQNRIHGKVNDSGVLLELLAGEVWGNEEYQLLSYGSKQFLTLNLAANKVLAYDYVFKSSEGLFSKNEEEQSISNEFYYMFCQINGVFKCISITLSKYNDQFVLSNRSNTAAKIDGDFGQLVNELSEYKHKLDPASAGVIAK